MTTGQPNRRALLIACGTYPSTGSFASLEGPTNDVALMKRVLSDPDLGRFDEVEVLEDQSSDTTRRTIEEWLVSGLEDEVVLLHFSGHGLVGLDGVLHLVTPDTQLHILNSSSVSMGFLRTVLSQAPQRQRVVFLDTCFSGAAEYTFSNLRGPIILESQFSAAGVFVLTSCAADEAARERVSERYGKTLGIFTEAIVHGIESGAADLDHDGQITFTELRQYVDREVPRQLPHYGAHMAHGDVVVAWASGSAKLSEIDQLKAKIEGLFRRGAIRPESYLRLQQALRAEAADVEGLSTRTEGVLDRILVHEREPPSDSSDQAGIAPEGRVVAKLVELSSRWVPPAAELPKLLSDPVYGTIELPDHLLKILAHPAFGRLRGVAAHPFATAVYPGARHTLAEHAVGVAHLTRRMFSAVWAKGVIWKSSGPSPIRGGKAKRLRIQRTAEVAALLHPLATPPWALALDPVLRSKLDTLDARHATLPWLIEQHLGDFLRSECDIDSEDVIAILMSDGGRSREWVTFASEALDSTVDLDRLDYVARDSFHAGLSSSNEFAVRLLTHVRPWARDGQVHLAFDQQAINLCQEFNLRLGDLHERFYGHRTVRMLTRLGTRVAARVLDELWDVPDATTRLTLLTDAEFIELSREALRNTDEWEEIVEVIARGVAPRYSRALSVPVETMHEVPRLKSLLAMWVTRNPSYSQYLEEIETEIAGVLGQPSPAVLMVMPFPVSLMDEGRLVYFVDEHDHGAAVSSLPLTRRSDRAHASLDVWVDSAVGPDATQRIQRCLDLPRDFAS